MEWGRRRKGGCQTGRGGGFLFGAEQERGGVPCSRPNKRGGGFLFEGKQEGGRGVAPCLGSHLLPITITRMKGGEEEETITRIIATTNHYYQDEGRKR